MEVPATTTAAVNAQNPSPTGTSDSCLLNGGTGSAGKGKLPAFASIMGELSVGESPAKGASSQAGLIESDDDGFTDWASRRPEDVGNSDLFGEPFVENKSVNEVRHSKQSQGSRLGKSESRVSWSRQGAISTDNPKKHNVVDQTATTAPTTPTAPTLGFVANSIPTFDIEKWSHIPTGSLSPVDSLAVQKHLSMSQNHKEISHVYLPVGAVSEVATPKGTPPVGADVPSREIRPEWITLGYAHDGLIVAKETGSPNSLPPNLSGIRQQLLDKDISFLPESPNNEDGVALPLVMPAVQAPASLEATPPTSKLKVQEKTNSGSVSGPGSHTVFSDAPLTISPQVHGTALAATVPARATDAANPSFKQEVSLEVNPFQRLDASEAPATLLHSSSHQLAVGVRDPALGWLELQAQSSSGHISATLTATSTEAHASLTMQTSAITQYLADRNISVDHLNIHTHAEMQNGGSSGGQSQSQPENSRYEMPERQAITIDGSKRSALNGTESESVMRSANASYISVRA